MSSVKSGPTMTGLWAMRNVKQSLTPTERHVIHAFLAFMNADCMSAPGIAGLIRTTGYQRRTVQVTVDRLEAMGIVSVQLVQTRDRCAVYRVHVDRLREDKAILDRPIDTTSSRYGAIVAHGLGDRDAPVRRSSCTLTGDPGSPSEDLMRISDEDHEDQIPQTPFLGRDQDPPTTPSQGILPKVIADDCTLRTSTGLETLTAPAVIATLPASPPAFAQATLLDLGPTQEAPDPPKARKTPPKAKAEKSPKPPKADKPPKVKKPKEESAHAQYMAAFNAGIAKAIGQPFALPLIWMMKFDLITMANTHAIDPVTKAKITGDALIAWFQERAEAFRNADVPSKLEYNGGYTPRGMLWWLNNGCEGEQVARQKYVAPKPYIQPPWSEQLETMKQKAPDKPQTWIVFEEMAAIEKRLGFAVSFVEPAGAGIFHWWRKQTAGDKAEDARPELRERLDKLLDDGKIVRRVEVAE